MPMPQILGANQRRQANASAPSSCQGPLGQYLVGTNRLLWPLRPDFVLAAGPPQPGGGGSRLTDGAHPHKYCIQRSERLECEANWP